MPAHDEPAVLPLEGHQRPMALLAAEMAAYEQAVAPPTELEWAAYMYHEEERLEMRCAELIASLTPALASPSPVKRRSRRAPRNGSVQGLGSSSSSVMSSTPSAADGVDATDDDDAPTSADEEETGGLAGELSLDADATCGVCEGSEAGVVVDGRVELPKGGKVKGGGACKSCGCRLPLTACAAACKCGHIFCAAHMHEHACAFDYKAPHEAKLRTNNPKTEGAKLERM